MPIPACRRVLWFANELKATFGFLKRCNAHKRIQFLEGRRRVNVTLSQLTCKPFSTHQEVVNNLQSTIRSLGKKSQEKTFTIKEVKTFAIKELYLMLAKRLRKVEVILLILARNLS